ncbi:MAG: DUF255 domain-containing protein [Clostridia bacterium]|nr:DUF255 domain-containing protein [Clostridia bacterium]
MRVSSIYPSSEGASGDSSALLRPFDDAAFDEARRAHIPVFLIIGEADPALCDPALHAHLSSRTVPVRLLPGMRPDVELLCQRCGALTSGEGVLPLYALLLENGLPFLAAPAPPAGYPLDPSRLLAWLEHAERRFHQNHPAMTAQAAQVLASISGEKGARTLSPQDAADRLLHTLTTAEDKRRGGFAGVKAPYVPALLFLHHAGSSGHGVLARALDAMLASALYDPLDGLFFRSTLTEDWRLFTPEKPLGVNALLALLLLLNGHRSEAVRTLDSMLSSFDVGSGSLCPLLRGDSAAYAFSADQVCSLLGCEDGLRACRLLSLLRSRSGETPKVTPSRFSPLPAAPARAFYQEDPLLTPTLSASVTPDDAAFLRRAIPVLRRARAARTPERPSPVQLPMESGVAAAVLARCGRRLGEPRYVQAAQRIVSRLVALPPPPGAPSGLPPAYAPSRQAYASCGAAAALALAQLTLGQGEGMDEYARSGMRTLSRALYTFVRQDGLVMHTPDDPAAFLPRLPALCDSELPSPAALLAGSLRIAHTLYPGEGCADAADTLWRAAAPIIRTQGAACAALTGVMLMR